jgi:uncharacterized membrane protein
MAAVFGEEAAEAVAGAAEAAVVGPGSPAAAGVSAAAAREEAGDMKARDFLSKLDHNKIVQAIADAESKMTGEIRIFITRKEPEDPVAAAHAHFVHLHMDATSERNGVLIFVAPRVRKFAIIGDREVHAKCGDVFWREVADGMSGHFRQGEFTVGILHGIRRAGELLAVHFPHRLGGKNELSNEIAHD